MKLDNETIAKIANLARLEIDESEKEAVLDEMNKILSFMEKLNELDTNGVEPLIYLTNKANVFREDVIKQEITVKEALQNAPDKDDKYFKVAKVIDKG